MPSVIVFPVSNYLHFAGALPQLFQFFHRLQQFLLSTNNANKVLHHLLQIILHLEWIITLGPFKWFQYLLSKSCNFMFINNNILSIFFGKLCCIFSCAFSKNQEVGK